jgi:hypothetical protein
MTFSKLDLTATISINDTQPEPYAEHHFLLLCEVPLCRLQHFNDMLSVAMLNIFMLSVVAPF